MKKKIIITVLLIVSIIADCFLAIKMYKDYVDNMVEVCVASHQISQRTLISQEDLEKIMVPKSVISEDMYFDEDDVIGKYCKLSYSIPKGSFIYKTSLENDIKDLAHTLLKQGEVNYDIYTNDIKINTANLSKNMNLDLYLTISNKDVLCSDLLISNCRITGMYDNNNKPILDYDGNSKVHIITIAINEDYVNVLNKAKMIGEINSCVSNNAYIDSVSILNADSDLMMYLQ